MECILRFQVVGSEVQLPVSGDQDNTKDWDKNLRNIQSFLC